MRYILIFLLTLSSYAFGQKNLQKTPYERKMDSITISRISFKLNDLKYKNFVYDFKTKRVKLSLSTRINVDMLDDNEMDNLFTDQSADDYLSIFKYDARVKFYLSRDLSFFTRAVIIGNRYRENQYLVGFYIKF